MILSEHELSVEVEQNLLQDAAVTQARLVNLSTSGGNEAQWAVAIALAKNDCGGQSNGPLLERLRKNLLVKLKGYDKTLVPKKWFLLPKLPVAPSGHVEDELLLQHLMSLDADHNRPSMQDKLRNILSKVLRIPFADVLPSASFVRLGGDSITAIEVMSRCLEENINLQARDLMKCESLAELETATNNYQGPSTDVMRNTAHDLMASPKCILAYWDALAEYLGHGYRASHRFHVSGQIGKMLLHDCPSTLRVTPVEICMAAVRHSFQKIFTDRETLAALVVCSQPKTSEPLAVNMSLAPIDDFKTTMCRTKDSFAHSRAVRSASSTSVLSFTELRVHYVSECYPVSSSNRVKADGHANGYASRLAHETETTLFNFKITAHEDNFVAFDIDYARKTARQCDILKWIETCRAVLEGEIPLLIQSAPLFSLSDFPYLPLSYPELERLVNSIGDLGHDEIESAYPTLPAQDGILLSQVRSPALYKIASIFEIKHHKSTVALSLDVLEQAWNDVVARNPSLRTVFIPSVCGGFVFNQVILKNIHPETVRLGGFGNGKEAVAALRALELATFVNHRPGHRLTICNTADGHTYCKLEISHANVDGMSVPLIFKELCSAYEGHLPYSSVFTFRDYMSFFRNQSKDHSLKYWLNILDGVEPCHFPSLGEQTTQSVVMKKILIDVDSTGIKSFCMARGITPAILFQSVWGVIIRAYTLADDVCFGYLVSGRDVPIAGINELIGPLINLLVCRIRFGGLKTFEDLLLNLQNQVRHAMDNQYGSIADIQHSVAPGQRRLFNTIISMMYSPDESEAGTKLHAQVVDNRAPTEVRPN